jgi:hypothetical protein
MQVRLLIRFLGLGINRNRSLGFDQQGIMTVVVMVHNLKFIMKFMHLAIVASHSVGEDFGVCVGATYFFGIDIEL